MHHMCIITHLAFVTEKLLLHLFYSPGVRYFSPIGLFLQFLRPRQLPPVFLGDEGSSLFGLQRRGRIISPNNKQTHSSILFKTHSK